MFYVPATFMLSFVFCSSEEAKASKKVSSDYCLFSFPFLSFPFLSFPFRHDDEVTDYTPSCIIQQKTLIRQFSNGEERLQKKQPIRNQDDSKLVWIIIFFFYSGFNILSLLHQNIFMISVLSVCVSSPVEGVLQRSHIHNYPGRCGSDGKRGDQRRGRQTWHHWRAGVGPPQLFWWYKHRLNFYMMELQTDYQSFHWLSS